MTTCKMMWPFSIPQVISLNPGIINVIILGVKFKIAFSIKLLHAVTTGWRPTLTENTANMQLPARSRDNCYHMTFVHWVPPRVPGSPRSALRSVSIVSGYSNIFGRGRFQDFTCFANSTAASDQIKARPDWQRYAHRDLWLKFWNGYLETHVFCFDAKHPRVTVFKDLNLIRGSSRDFVE